MRNVLSVVLVSAGFVLHECYEGSLAPGFDGGRVFDVTDVLKMLAMLCLLSNVFDRAEYFS